VQVSASNPGPIDTGFTYYLASEEIYTWLDNGGGVGNVAADSLGIYVRAKGTSDWTNIALLPDNSTVGPTTINPFTNTDLYAGNGTAYYQIYGDVYNGIVPAATCADVSSTVPWYARPNDASALLRAELSLQPGGEWRRGGQRARAAAHATGDARRQAHAAWSEERRQARVPSAVDAWVWRRCACGAQQRAGTGPRAAR
jgi:hypothetical protein